MRLATAILNRVVHTATDLTAADETASPSL